MPADPIAYRDSFRSPKMRMRCQLMIEAMSCIIFEVLNMHTLAPRDMPPLLPNYYDYGYDELIRLYYRTSLLTFRLTEQTSISANTE